MKIISTHQNTDIKFIILTTTNAKNIRPLQEMNQFLTSTSLADMLTIIMLNAASVIVKCVLLKINPIFNDAHFFLCLHLWNQPVIYSYILQ